MERLRRLLLHVVGAYFLLTRSDCEKLLLPCYKMVVVFGVGLCRSSRLRSTTCTGRSACGSSKQASVVLIFVSFCGVASPAVFPANGVLVVHGSESRAACIRNPNQTTYTGVPIATQCCWQTRSVQRSLHKPEYPYPYNVPPFDVRHEDRGPKHSCHLEIGREENQLLGGCTEQWQDSSGNVHGCAHTARRLNVPPINTDPRRFDFDSYDANCRFGVYTPPGATRNLTADQTALTSVL